MGRPYSNPDWSPYKKRTSGHRDAQTEERSREDTASRQPSASQRQRPQKKSNMQIPSNLQNGNKINFYC